MARFEKSKFEAQSEYVTYEGRFVARIKGGGNKKHFISFLIANFEVEEYFKMLEVDRIAPAKVLETKGYVSMVVQKILNSAGYPTTLEGRTKYLKDMSMRSQL